MNSPSACAPITFRGSALARSLLRWWGWRVHFDGLPALQGVVVVYPHTSNWDFLAGILFKWAVGVPVHFWGKDTLFAWPLFGRWLRWVGGVPLNRRSPQGTVGEMVQTLRDHRAHGRLFWLALAPEGTRRRTPGWRTGFYQVVLGAQVPLGLARLDWGRKTIDWTTHMALQGDEAIDFERMREQYRDVQGFHPDQACPITPWRPGKENAP